MKDAFPDSSTNTKPETEGMEQVEKATEEAVQAKKDFATANEGVQFSIDGSENPLKLEAELMEQIAKSAREAADAKKEFVEANKQVKDSANKSNNDLVGGHSENTEPSSVKKYKKKGYKAHDTGNHDNEKKVSNKAELGKALKDLQSEIIASIDESTSFVKEVTDFYDSQDNLVKTQMKIGDKNGSMRTYTTSYSMDKDGNATAWTSHIETQKIAEQAKQEASNIQTEWDKNIKAIQDYMDAMTKLNNLKAKDKGTGSEANQIALQTQNVEELKQTALEARKNLSSMQAENPDIIIWKQWVDMMELFDQASKGSAESAAKLKDVLDNIKAPSLDKYENKLSSYQAKTGGYDATIARFKDGGWTSPEYLKNVQAVEAAVKKYEDLLSNIKAKGGIASEKDVQTLKEYEGEIKKTISTVTNMSAAEKGYNFVSGQKELDKIHKLLNENSKMSSDAKAKIRAYYREIESGNPSMSLDRIHGEIMKIYNAEVEAGRAGRTFLDTLKNSGFHQFAAQMAGMFSFYDIINVARQGINTIRELDEAMTEVRKVSEATESQYSSFQQTVASTAKEIASTNNELLNSSADFLRLGYDLNQAEDLAKNATLFVNVGDGVDITAATEDMITAMKAFDIQAEDSIKIVDDYNQIGNMYALSATDIGEAMKRSASALETGNNSFEQSIGLITAMNEIVQNSENTGNTLKVLSLRLRGAKAELESMSEDTDGLCDSTSKLREQIQALTGVDIMLDDNTFKSTADIIKELGAVWNNLTDSSQAATLEIIAGKTRANNVAALLKNYQQIDNVISDLGDAQGSAARENAAIIDSINGRIKILSASAEEFWQTVINKDAVKNAVTFASDLLGVLSKVIDKIGVLPTLLTGVGAGLSLKNIGKCYVSA